MPICLCSHLKEEHDNDPNNLDINPCTVDGCECDFFEEDEDAEVEEEED